MRFNPFSYCKKYDLPLWRCPQFLFLVMGGLIIISALITYFFGTRYIGDPITVSFVVLGITAVLFIFTYILTKSLENLMEANRMKAEFIKIISHQLRSPLTNLKWMVEYLVSKKAEPSLLNYLNTLKDNVLRMEKLLSDLVLISKIEERKIVFSKTNFSLVDLTEKILSRYRPSFERKNITFSFNSSNSFEVLGDPSQIETVIEILIDNALRYTKENGEIKIEISPSLNKKNLIFKIKDTGIGIPKEDQKYIFQKFFRAKNASTCEPHGTGLGLYIAKSIIERSGGRMGFQSKEGKGSLFWFSLPQIKNKISKL